MRHGDYAGNEDDVAYKKAHPTRPGSVISFVMESTSIHIPASTFSICPNPTICVTLIPLQTSHVIRIARLVSRGGLPDYDPPARNSPGWAHVGPTGISSLSRLYLIRALKSPANHELEDSSVGVNRALSAFAKNSVPICSGQDNITE